MCPEEAGRCGICNTGVVVCNIGQAGWVFSWRSSGSSCGVSKELWAYRNTLEQRLEGCGELVGVQSRISNRLKQAGMKWLSKRLHVSREGQLQSCEISSLRTYLLSDVPFFSRHLSPSFTHRAQRFLSASSCRLSPLSSSRHSTPPSSARHAPNRPHAPVYVRWAEERCRHTESTVWSPRRHAKLTLAALLAQRTYLTTLPQRKSPMAKMAPRHS